MVIPRDGDKVTIGRTELTWHAVDTRNYNVNLFHFARAHGKKTSDVLFWANRSSVFMAIARPSLMMASPSEGENR